MIMRTILGTPAFKENSACTLTGVFGAIWRIQFSSSTLISTAEPPIMQIPGNDETEIKALCDEMLDHLEILANLIYLVGNSDLPNLEKEKYLKISNEVLNKLCQIVRKHC